MINIDFLEYLVEYAKTENLTKASNSLHISQSALTRAMQKVEDYVGVPIFERSKNKLSLTETGLELVKNAKIVIETEKAMKERTVAFYNSITNISVGTIAPSPMIKYGNLLFSVFPGKTIFSKIDSKENLLEKLKDGTYDFIFTTEQIDSDEIASKYVFTEKLYITNPKTHFLSKLTQGVHFKEIDGQSFLVADNLGLWDEIVAKNLPKSKFFPQSMENLYEIINASTIPNFSTNITLPLRSELDRMSLPILDEEASVTFYLAYKKQNKLKLKNLLNIINKNS